MNNVMVEKELLEQICGNGSKLCNRIFPQLNKIVKLAFPKTCSYYCYDKSENTHRIQLIKVFKNQEDENLYLRATTTNKSC